MKTLLIVIVASILPQLAQARILACESGETLMKSMRIVQQMQCPDHQAIVVSGQEHCASLSIDNVLPPGVYRGCIRVTGPSAIITAAHSVEGRKRVRSSASVQCSQGYIGTGAQGGATLFDLQGNPMASIPQPTGLHPQQRGFFEYSYVDSQQDEITLIQGVRQVPGCR